MSKPPKFSRRTGTVSKAKRMQGLDKYFRNAKVISNQAKVAANKLEQKIDNEELDWCAYDCKERRHAHEEELKKKGKVVKKIDFNKFQPLYGEKKLPRFNLLAVKIVLLTNWGKKSLALIIGPATNWGKNETNNVKSRKFVGLIFPL